MLNKFYVKLSNHEVMIYANFVLENQVYIPHENVLEVLGLPFESVRFIGPLYSIGRY